MKKVFAILLALAMVFSLMACQSGDSSKTPDDPGKETTQKADDKTTKASASHRRTSSILTGSN